MAAATQRGYDPVAMACTQVDVQQAATTENGPSNLEDEGLFQLVSLRRKASQRQMATKGGAPAAPLPSKLSAGNPGGIVSNGSACAAQTRSKTTTRQRTNWFVISTSTWDLVPFLFGAMSNSTEKCAETTASLTGKVVWREGELAFVRKLGTSSVAVLTFVHYNCECSVVREYKTLPACYRCGTIGHRIDNRPHPDVERYGYCGQRVGASEQGLPEHECTPSCTVCVEAHLTGSTDCKGKFSRLHRPGTQQHGAPNNKTSKPSRNGGASSGKFRQATGPATGNNTSYSKKNKNRKASTRSAKSRAMTKAPTDNAEDFPPLESAPPKGQFTADTVQAYKSLGAYDYFESVSALPAGSADCGILWLRDCGLVAKWWKDSSGSWEGCGQTISDGTLTFADFTDVVKMWLVMLGAAGCVFLVEFICGRSVSLTHTTTSPPPQLATAHVQASCPKGVSACFMGDQRNAVRWRPLEVSAGGSPLRSRLRRPRCPAPSLRVVCLAGWG
ncbi:hypothetical protein HPB47_022504 [Ixodes persulcatus]|uniref:Uncharacterized protein n=1 Tax=Ixodes persulcatus TaxID=34615 RepID=A0AC60QBE3_IXOPE|nr:hypothetical protein HPB47_022504 [Ixodes persulcatus]